MSTEKNNIKILIVDDELEACRNLQNMLVEYVDTGLEICGTAHSAKEAETKIKTYLPDALFLDIEMPNENAFSFLNRIAPFNFDVVFVTAYDEYAVRAFKLNAIDYILKPISIQELGNAVRKLKERRQLKKILSTDLISFSEFSDQVANKTKQCKITLRDNNNIEVLDFKDIYFIEAQGSYSRIVFCKNNATREIMMSTSIAEYEEILPEDMFFRIHRSYLINCLQVNKITKDESNLIILKNDQTLPVSRRRFSLLLEFLKNNEYLDD
jgi:two-component system, LytTR family, response regulator